jgi:hypothetical protein
MVLTPRLAAVERLTHLDADGRLRRVLVRVAKRADHLDALAQKRPAQHQHVAELHAYLFELCCEAALLTAAEIEQRATENSNVPKGAS